MLSKLVGGLIAVAALAGAAEAAPITYISTGTIISGTDQRGSFSKGAAGQDLTGVSYSQRVTFDPSLIDRDVAAPDDYTFASGRLYSGRATAEITIGDVTHSFAWDANKFLYAQVALMNWLTQGGEPFDGVVFHTFGLTDDYTSVDVGTNVYSRINVFQLGLNIDQNWSYQVKPEDFIQDAAFSVSGADFEAAYLGRPEAISMQIAAEVPEPASISLLLAGCLLLAGARRSRAPNKADRR